MKFFYTHLLFGVVKKKSSNLFRTGTKIIIRKKTRGQDLSIDFSHIKKKPSLSDMVKYTVNPDTVELVRNDIIKANNISLKRCEI